jgi:hypothetical protein
VPQADIKITLGRFVWVVFFPARQRRIRDAYDIRAFDADGVAVMVAQFRKNPFVPMGNRLSAASFGCGSPIKLFGDMQRTCGLELLIAIEDLYAS